MWFLNWKEERRRQKVVEVANTLYQSYLSGSLDRSTTKVLVLDGYLFGIDKETPPDLFRSTFRHHGIRSEVFMIMDLVIIKINGKDFYLKDRKFGRHGFLNMPQVL